MYSIIVELYVTFALCASTIAPFQPQDNYALSFDYWIPDGYGYAWFYTWTEDTAFKRSSMKRYASGRPIFDPYIDYAIWTSIGIYTGCSLVI
jgi:hypothetical protein